MIDFYAGYDTNNSAFYYSYIKITEFSNTEGLHEIHSQTKLSYVEHYLIFNSTQKQFFCHFGHTN